MLSISQWPEYLLSVFSSMDDWELNIHDHLVSTYIYEIIDHVLSWPKGLLRFICSVAQLWLNLCDPTDCSTAGLPVHHQLPEFTQTCIHWVSDAIQPSHSLLSPSPPAFNLSQHRSLFQWVSSSHQVAKELELQLQHQSFHWIFKVDFFQDWLV